jgi:hypothetical protein
MERGVLAIFGGIPEESVESIKSFVNFHHVPFIAWNNPPYESEGADVSDEEDTEIREFDTDEESEETELARKRAKATTLAAKTNIPNSSQETVAQAHSYFLNMYPEISSVLISIIKYDRHKTVYYLYDDVSG